MSGNVFGCYTWVLLGSSGQRPGMPHRTVPHTQKMTWSKMLPVPNLRNPELR